MPAHNRCALADARLVGYSRAMMPDEMHEALKELGWTQGALAARLGVHRNTVGDWVRGHTEVPGYAVEYLRVVRLARRILDQVS